MNIITNTLLFINQQIKASISEVKAEPQGTVMFSILLDCHILIISGSYILSATLNTF